jgi:DNA-binding transcriptional ArsR family regulator
MDQSHALVAFAALSQSTRLDVFRLLVRAGGEGVAAGAIGQQLGVRQNTMSANLAVLARSGLVRFERDGRTVRYFADLAGIRRLLAFLVEDCCGGEPERCQPLIDEIICAC